ncbi:hypothetical protein MAPG_10156 [Magnaporthiopsis poae ATCC 64411]|uniref:Methyltransferase n=1 Tax=Magnaporthiopsis poae (strain ATCC 64411 / 73-15) TaxID=644358 RepID=A0A0C4EBU7_MAGP6|nr:hypothetical protein MAPG_10156 [Magnaporthiopsis poae ATCC 64411]
MGGAVQPEQQQHHLSPVFSPNKPSKHKSSKMATAAVQLPSPALNQGAPTVRQQQTPKQPQQQQQKRDVRATLNFYKPNADGSPPHPTYIDRPETFDRPNEPHDVLIRDVRGATADEGKSHTLDGSGFQFHKHVAAEKEFVDDDKIRAGYYAETEQLLKDVTGATRVFIFDHTIRRPPPPTASLTTRLTRGPVQRVHIDQSYSASLSRVPHHLPDEAETLLRGRVQIINVWRPIRRVDRDPLAVAEAASVSDADLIPTGLIYPDRKGETLQVRYNQEQKWWYKSAMEPGEVLLIKCFDSKEDGRARRVPHTAFVDPTADVDAPARESIEVRALVFHPEDRE